MPPTKPPRWPLVLLGLMTLFSFGGPILIGWSLRGGASPAWPPDRPLEWGVFAGVCAAVAFLMGACLSLAWHLRKSPPRPETRTGEAP